MGSLNSKIWKKMYKHQRAVNDQIFQEIARMRYEKEKVIEYIRATGDELETLLVRNQACMCTEDLTCEKCRAITNWRKATRDR